MAEVDLFGFAIEARRERRGRRRHVPTAAQRDQARALRGEGRPLLAIAQALGISTPTLLLNYPNEMETKSQAWRKRAARERME